MALLGLLLIVLGGAAGLVTFFSLGYDSDRGHDREVAILGSNNTTPEAVFIIGVVVATVVLLGLWCVKYGAQRGLRKRKESKRLNELHDRLEDADRRMGDDATA